MLFRMMCKCIIHNNSKLDSHDPPFRLLQRGKWIGLYLVLDFMFLNVFGNPLRFFLMRETDTKITIAIVDNL